MSESGRRKYYNIKRELSDGFGQVACTVGVGAVQVSGSESQGKALFRHKGESRDLRKPISPIQEMTTRYLRAMPLRELSDLKVVRQEIEAGNIIILKVTPLATRSVDDVKKAVNDLCGFVEDVDGDIARLGEERIVVAPSGVRIWREKTVSPDEEVPTAT